MNFPHKELIKNNLDSYLKSLNIDISNNFRCFNIMNHSNHDKKPSCKYYSSSFSIYCFGCGLKYDIYNVIGFEYGLNTFKEQYEECCRIFGLDDKYINNNASIAKIKPKKHIENNVEEKIYYDVDFTKKILEYFKKNKFESYKYFHNIRGISKKIIDKYRLLVCSPLDVIPVEFLPKYKNGNVIKDIVNYNILFPIWDCGKVTSIILRRNDGLTKNKAKFMNLRNVRLGIFNKNLIKTNIEKIYICESITDCLSLESIGLKAISLNSVSNRNRYLKLLKDNISIIKDKHFIICGDNDKQGQEMNSFFISELDKLKVSCSCLDIRSYKDINELLINNELSKLLKINKAC